ncbi:MAG: twin transmembrane helix small protein [Alphaproteobacteria bacterium]|nr:twin transmembrane helix small protein [Alphaproteobacteria bacterium]
MNIVSVLIIISLFSVVCVLAIGMVAMIKGGDFNQKYGNKLMWLRVGLQGVTISLLALAYMLSQSPS